tara:strand:- start:482 stop:1069 length:588 start_codon:yes stop_codon:yes gene_type:complete
MENITLQEKLSRIQKEFKANKSKFNSFGKYNFRSAEDILEALKPYNEKYSVSFIIIERMINFDPPIIQSQAIIFDNNGVNKISASAVVGVDLEQKGMQMPQKYGSASSYGKKYALGNLLLIDDSQDADATNKHGKEQVKSADNFVFAAMPDEKKWLNVNTPEFKKAVQYLKDGGNISNIEVKYKMTKETKIQLFQ